MQLHPDKIRLIEFGRYTAQTAKGLGRPESFNFLGFTHICGRTRQSRLQILRKSRRDCRTAKRKEIKTELRRRMHWPIPEQGQWLKQVFMGYYAYHAVPTTFRSLGAFHDHIIRLWAQTLRRQSQSRQTPRDEAVERSYTWEQLGIVKPSRTAAWMDTGPVQVSKEGLWATLRAHEARVVSLYREV